MRISSYRLIDPRHGSAIVVAPTIRRLVADNGGPFTYSGTGSYIIGRGSVAIIDPGPAIEAHVDALLTALDGERISHILITHTHADHSPAAALLKGRTGAKTYGFGPHGADETDAAEEAADYDFQPDISLEDGDLIEGEGFMLEAVHTPGHTSNHLCFGYRAEGALFSGDHVMGWSTSVIAPPDGDMAAYLQSLEKVAARGDAVLWPTHGPPIRRPEAHVRALIAHRLAREASILAALQDGARSIPDLVERIYEDVPKALHRAAALSVSAHLIKLIDEKKASRDGALFQAL